MRAIDVVILFQIEATPGMCQLPTGEGGKAAETISPVGTSVHQSNGRAVLNLLRTWKLWKMEQCSCSSI